jgi:hypothetical protein
MKIWRGSKMGECKGSEWGVWCEIEMAVVVVVLVFEFEFGVSLE